MSGIWARGARTTSAVIATTITALVSTALLGCGADAVGSRSTSNPTAVEVGKPCDWPMTGFASSRTFATPCASDITVDSVDRLEQAWFFNADDVVSGSPAVVDGTAYFGDWSGKMYAVDTTTGKAKWTYQTEVHTPIYAGQITGGPAVAELGGERTVVVGGGKTLYALKASDGSLRWKHTLNPSGTGDPTEIESSVVVTGNTVIAGWDVHNTPGFRAGVIALDGNQGNTLWTFDGDEGRPPTGCSDVWGSPSVDEQRQLVFFGTGNCTTSPKDWGRYTEAIVALRLDDGAPAWTYQPHPPNNDDLDFAGFPNLFRIGDRDVVGLGNKDGTYYTVDRVSGELVWKTKATDPGVTDPGSNFSTGGFIGGTGVSDGVIAGGTAVGPPPFLHGLDTSTGKVLWQQTKAEATYASSAIVNGVLFSGGNDFTFRALNLRTGDILWSSQMSGAVAGGAAIVGDAVYAVAGIREPGSNEPSRSSGVTKFVLRPAGQAASTTTMPAVTTGTGVSVTKLTNAAGSQRCIGAACPLPFNLKPVPDGLDPKGTLEVQPDPYRITVTASGLGRPEQWLNPGTDAAAEGAKVFALYISESDDNPVGGLLCVLDDAGTCSATTLPRSTTYNRITLLAANDPSNLPPIAQGLARIITTISFDPRLDPTPP